jgi:outer membrane receptor for ferrienterochelin and colicin
VVVDGARFGELEELRRIPAEDVERIHFLRGPDATTIYGTGYGGGAIEVTTRRR